jgi:hypothetical protein
MENSEGHKKVKHRSPSTPAIGLEKALAQAQRLWDVAGKHAAPLESAMKAWGYSPKSSGGLQTIAALKQYGLAEDSGTGWNRQVSLTKLAQELLVYGADKDSQEWESRARIAALQPKVHARLWNKYDGSLPDDSVMLPHLKLDLNFSDEAARDMLKRFRATIAYAKVSDGAGTVSENGEDGEGTENGNNGDAEAQIVTPAAIERPPGGSETPKTPEQRTVQVTYSPTAWALVQAPFPLSNADWEAMMRVLEGMKPGLVQLDE